jgi:hypothetical protein
MESKETDGLIDITEESTEVVTEHTLDFIEQKGLEHFTLETLATEVFDFAYIQLLTAMDKLAAIKEEVDAKVKELIKEQYLINGQNSVKSGSFSMTLIPENFRERFDMAKFKKEEPALYEELYAKYKVISKVSDSLRVNRKKVKED